MGRERKENGTERIGWKKSAFLCSSRRPPYNGTVDRPRLSQGQVSVWGSLASGFPTPGPEAVDSS